MIKCVVTGDNHFGKPYGGRFESKKTTLIEKRFESLEDLVNKANEIDADLFIVTGDLFDNESEISRDIVSRVVGILAKFKNNVFVLPGNHDFYGDHVEVWKIFKDCNHYDNIVLLSSPEPKTFTDIGKDKDTVVLYPAICKSKHSDTNALGWIKDADIKKEGVINIGLAHGAVEKLSCDNEHQYFYMGRDELKNIDVDVWFVGHAHVQLPDDLTETEQIRTDKIYNPGTHQQTSSNNNTEVCGFIITISKDGSKATVKASKYSCGNIRYVKKQITIPVADDNALRDALMDEVKDYDKDSTVLELSFKGTVLEDEYIARKEICDKVLEGFFHVDEYGFGNLYEEATPAKIDQEFVTGSFASDFMHSITDSDARNTAFEYLTDIKKGRISFKGDEVNKEGKDIKYYAHKGKA